MFLNLGFIDISDQRIRHEGFPVHCRMFHSIPDSYPLSARWAGSGLDNRGTYKACLGQRTGRSLSPATRIFRVYREALRGSFTPSSKVVKALKTAPLSAQGGRYTPSIGEEDRPPTAWGQLPGQRAVTAPPRPPPAQSEDV